MFSPAADRTHWDTRVPPYDSFLPTLMGKARSGPVVDNLGFPIEPTLSWYLVGKGAKYSV